MSAEELRIRLVAALMAWHGITPTQLSELLGNARDTVYKKLEGKRAFTLRDLEVIAATFGVDAGLLVLPHPAEAVLGAVRQPDADLLTCTFKLFPQVRGYGQPLFGIPAKSALFASSRAA